ncbi:ABC transporter ATP-binding protein [Flexibacterium corallicola]|uniref:ABC transporter ATP-binding protein n=1 Tax=Flexibacterium corallicola TaxID=3037259 RepID=UPI00286F8EE8|nr:dipeptide ABC transporter ATP-binding protein [Pseudovibrio sp. M1P-2-3]
MSLLSLNNLHLSIGDTPILKGISLSVEQGETLGLVGESGSGKSLSALAALQLLPEGSSVQGSITYNGAELVGAPEGVMNRLRGKDISMVFQEPMTALNPTKTIGNQIAEGIRLHQEKSSLGGKREIEKQVQNLLERVGLSSEASFRKRYPHQLSGGQRQRVVIAIAIACRPKVLIADEPTTALDVTVQAQILDLLKDVVAQENMALLLISHDLAVVAHMADRIAIMQHGQVVEEGPTDTLFETLSHPYSQKLVEASSHTPPQRKRPVKQDAAPLLAVESLVRSYPLPRQVLFEKRRHHVAVNQLSFALHHHQSLGLVGESGCGKSTLARTVLGLDTPQAGAIRFLEKDPFSAQGAERLSLQKGIQAVFQDPFGSFNPRHKVERIIKEPLFLLRHQLSTKEQERKVYDALEAVGLSQKDAQKYPHEFSGGQRQRIAIARALVTQPKLIVADEPVSALDVSIRAQILDLFADLRDRLGVAYLFISHDLSVVQAITDHVLVMHNGEIVEQGPTAQVFASPSHAYTRKLVEAAPNLHEVLEQRKRRVSF